MAAELLLDAHAELGEGPAWEAATRTLYWVDILAGCVHAFDTDTKRDDRFDLGQPVGCLAPRRIGGLILALRFGFATLSLPAGILTNLATPEADMPHNRFNDGKCDPAGRFLAGSMDLNAGQPTGALYSLSPAGQVTRLRDKVTISNGLTWSPDYKTFYYIDTPTRQVLAYDYDLETGSIANPRPVIFVPPEMGLPDGMTSDLEGNLWIALWDGAAVSVWNPARGRLIRTISIPAQRPTACVFGGEKMDVLYVTSARLGLDKAALSRYPHSGGLFRVQTDTQGLPTFPFTG